MANLRRQAVSVFALSLLMALCGGSLQARADREYAALILDSNTGAALYAKNADEPRYPASLTKMMTLYILFERIEQGRLMPGGKLTISANAASTPPSRLELRAGDEIAVLDAAKALITKSANDVAVAIAENIAGSEPAFARLMTQKAQQLGLKHTVFRNASGLPDAEQVTTARDMVTLAQHLNDDFPSLFKLFALKTFNFNGATYRNHNNLLFNFPGTDGIKTGYISRSGFNLVVSVHRQNKHVIGAVFGGATAGARDAHMRGLLGSALSKASNTPRAARPLVVARGPTVVPRLVRSPHEAVATPAGAPRTLPWLTAGAAPSTHVNAQVKPATETAANTKFRNLNPPVEVASVRPTLVPAKIAGPLRATETPTAAQTRALAPSTLQMQAEHLRTSAAGGPLPRPEAAKRPVSATGDGGFQIQIGAFTTIAEAERNLISARTAVGRALDGHPPVTQGIMRLDRQLFRARFGGFDQAGAQGACGALKQQKIDCLVMKAE